MNIRNITKTIAICIMLTSLAGLARAENIDPYDDDSQYAWGENVGWINFEPAAGEGVQVSSSTLEGFVWAENIGWINLSPSTYGGVSNDGSGNLTGYAWGENVGWISFSCANTGTCGSVDYGVSIDSDGNFSGYAWGENIGWINFGLLKPVRACKVCIDDLANFVDDWLTATSEPGDLDGDSDVDMTDYATLASYWLDYCPDAWPLK
jgi:hypothetical protein